MKVVPDASITDDPEKTTLAPNKIHIRGLDTVSTDDVRNFVKEHFGSLDRVEWIDDESANILFPSESTAQDALQALSAVPIADVTHLPLLENVPAKPFSSKPDVNFLIRLAVLADKKAPGAAARSRYYLFHPDEDPEERRRQRERRYRDRDEGNQRRGGRGRRRRDSDEEVETFDAGMYDDDEATLADRAAKDRRSRRSKSRDVVDRNQGKELFPVRSSADSGRTTRPRSASPLRDRDGDAAMDREERRAGTSGNRRRASGLREQLSNSSKELFPTRNANGRGTHMDAAEEASRLMTRTLKVEGEEESSKADPQDLFSIKGRADRKGRDTGFAIKGAAGASVKELFPGKFGQNKDKELFADKLEGRARPRKKAEDLFS